MKAEAPERRRAVATAVMAHFMVFRFVVVVVERMKGVWWKCGRKENYEERN